MHDGAVEGVVLYGFLAQYSAFGKTGGARGIYKKKSCIQANVRIVVITLCGFQQIMQFQPSRALFSLDGDKLTLRKFGSQIFTLCAIGFINKQRHRATVFQHIQMFFGCKPPVEWHEYRPQSCAGEDQHENLRMVLTQVGDAITRSYTESIF